MTDFPTSIPAARNYSLASTEPLDGSGATHFKHTEQHKDVWDFLRQIATKVGIDNSADTSSIDYKLRAASNTRTVTANTAFTAADFTIRYDTTAGNLTSTLPDAVALSGKIFNAFKPVAANTLNFATTGGQLINGAAPGSVTSIGSTTFQSNGTGWDIL